MKKSRIEAFSDGVLAIIITIMVLKLKTPEDISWSAFKGMYPTLLAYILSYVYVGIYWTNHHHLLSSLEAVTGKILWRNLNWLFWMSLIPTATEWMGLNPFEKLPTFFYGVIMFLSALSYLLLQNGILKTNDKDSEIIKTFGRDIKGKGSVAVYASAVIFSFISPIISYIIFVLMAVVWIVPDKRFELK